MVLERVWWGSLLHGGSAMRVVDVKRQAKLHQHGQNHRMHDHHRMALCRTSYPAFPCRTSLPVPTYVRQLVRHTFRREGDFRS